MTERVKTVMNATLQMHNTDLNRGGGGGTLHMDRKYAITATQMRHIFVTGARSGDTPFTPEQEQAAAYLMGNSRKTWDSSYDQGMVPRKVTHALAGIARRVESDTSIPHVPLPPPVRVPVPVPYISIAEAGEMGGVQLRILHQQIFALGIPTNSHNLVHLRRAVTGTQTRGPRRSTTRCRKRNRTPPPADDADADATADAGSLPIRVAIALSDSDDPLEIRMPRIRHMPRVGVVSESESEIGIGSWINGHRQCVVA